MAWVYLYQVSEAEEEENVLHNVETGRVQVALRSGLKTTAEEFAACPRSSDHAVAISLSLSPHQAADGKCRVSSLQQQQQQATRYGGEKAPPPTLCMATHISPSTSVTAAAARRPCCAKAPVQPPPAIDASSAGPKSSNDAILSSCIFTRRSMGRTLGAWVQHCVGDAD
ncbi:hypothetical protein ACJ73_07597 [Blastomyces percursus]|uniref:Uncharacterized protein n=1 Tax=Blastomyces percursus TaxID=1658174 RepID=A0A1J9PXK1_9EURO|nr:hypothetical protein ACJ73_07597 [Blastomyces percursus]